MTCLIEEFTAAYTEAIYFTDTGDLGQPERNAELAPETVARIAHDCRDFLQRVNYLADCDMKKAGHDFWLTRNGHGAGFWDGDWAEEHGKVLTALSETFGEITTYLGDDCAIYFG